MIIGILVCLFLGTICNTLSIITFCQTRTRGMGNGIYRLWISIIGQIGTTAITIRLLLIFVTKSSQWITCFGLDYVISVSIALYYSLTACIAI
ncbi:unnamed protein product [Rotaria sordida]|uniref:Uncharacterized protein n=1 Tax=Rotaria sordida TaxID=392033 RepID=A0A818YNI3_9BILA|nr:unnamed protein product [Rotaria sordida]CAF3752295.1 unnamed protein product [Rotaria sordida]